MSPHILDAQIPEINPTGAPGDDFEHIQSSAQDFGAFGAQAAEKLGAGLEKAGTTGIDLATEQNTLQNRIHGASINNWAADRFGDALAGFTDQRGRAASDGLQDYRSHLRKIRDQALASVPSLQEKAEVASSVGSLLDRYDLWGTSHADKERKEWDTKTNADSVISAGNQALIALNHDDPDTFHSEIDIAAQTAAWQLRSRGYDDATIATEVAKTRGVYITEALKMTLARGDPHNIAGELAKKYEGLVDPASMVQINGLLSAHRDQKASDALAQKSITAASTTPPVTGVPAKTGIPVSYLSAIQKSEGFDPVPKWDVKQWTVGYGTRASGPDERPSKAELDQRFHNEIGGASSIVDRVNPNLDPGTKAALTSLTYRTGDAWTRSGLGAAVRAGNIPIAQQIFLQYNKVAGGYSQPAADRVAREANWFGQPEAPAQSGPSGASNVRSSAYQVAMSDPGWEQASPEVRHQTLTKITQAVNDAEIASNQDAKAKKAAVDHAAGGYITEFYDMLHSPNPDYVALAGRINHDPALADSPAEKASLMERVRKASGEEQSLAFGPGYRDARAALFSDPEAPGHVTSVAQFANNDDITMAGLEDLNKRFSLAKRSPDRMANEKIITSFLTDAKQQMVHDQDIGTVKIPDPKGAHLYNSEFVPRFIKQAAKLQDEAEKTGNADKLDKFLSRDNVDKMINEVYPLAQRHADQISALSAEGVPEPAGAPLPLPPEGFNEAGWKSAVSSPPLIGAGQPMTHAQWSQALEILGKNPTPEVQAAFNKRFGVGGYDAAKIVQQMRPDTGAQATEVPAAAKENFRAADKEMNLTPQEKSLYERHLGNVTGSGGVTNSDGSRSTLLAMSVGFGDRTYIIPKVWDGKILTSDEAIARAKKDGVGKFPSYATPQEAEDRYKQLHEFIAKDVPAATSVAPAPSAQPSAHATAPHGTLPPQVREEAEARDKENRGRTAAREAETARQLEEMNKKMKTVREGRHPKGSQ